ncbi:MAG: acetyltransferase, family [Bacillales bacterium]|jgi:ElaA protein|nr:acetyltransferase, family [Bacillales bacterium]
MEWFLKGFNDLKVEELYRILSLRAEIFIVEQNCPYQDIDFKDLKSKHLFAMIDGEVAAYCRIVDKGVSFEEISIGRVIVKDKYRTIGLGQQMMRMAIKYITDEMNESYIRISAQAYLKNFYSSLGFEQVSEVYLEDDIPHIEMLRNKNSQA